MIQLKVYLFFVCFLVLVFVVFWGGFFLDFKIYHKRFILCTFVPLGVFNFFNGKVSLNHSLIGCVNGQLTKN